MIISVRASGAFRYPCCADLISLILYCKQATKGDRFVDETRKKCKLVELFNSEQQKEVQPCRTPPTGFPASACRCCLPASAPRPRACPANTRPLARPSTVPLSSNMCCATAMACKPRSSPTARSCNR
ncbi:hypothetical protein EMIT0P201_40060 [Pseudomonas chlororaphis]